MKKWIAAGFVMVTVIFAAVIAIAPSASAQGEGSSVTQQILELENAHRVQAGLAPLTLTEDLSRDAAIRVGECATHFSHTRPDGSVWWSLDPDRMWGENLAYGYADAWSTVRAWMGSPAHYANIMDAGFKTTGIGVVYAGDRYYYVQEFGY